APAVKNFVKQQELPSAETYKSINDFASLTTKLDEDAKSYAETPEVLKSITNAQSSLKSLFGKKETFDSAVWQMAEDRLPEFFYFADYSKLPYWPAPGSEDTELG